MPANSGDLPLILRHQCCAEMVCPGSRSGRPQYGAEMVCPGSRSGRLRRRGQSLIAPPVSSHRRSLRRCEL